MQKTQKNLIESLRKRELGYTASFSRLHLNSLESFKKQLLFPSFPKPKTAKEVIHFKNLINKRMAGLNDWFESKYLTTEARRYEIREAVLHHMTILARLDMINLAV